MWIFMKKILGFLLVCSFLINFSVFADTPEEEIPDANQRRLELLQSQLEKEKEKINQYISDFNNGQQKQYQANNGKWDQEYNKIIQSVQTDIQQQNAKIQELEQEIARVQKKIDRQAKKNGQTTTSYNTPTKLLDAVAWLSNKTNKIQDTALDGVTSQSSSCGIVWGNLTKTLCYLKENIHPYIQWIVYAWLALSLIFLIYNGFKMVTNVMNGWEGDIAKVRTNILYIWIGVIILTGFYYILDIIMAIINFLFE